MNRIGYNVTPYNAAKTILSDPSMTSIGLLSTGKGEYRISLYTDKARLSLIEMLKTLWNSLRSFFAPNDERVFRVVNPSESTRILCDIFQKTLQSSQSTKKEKRCLQEAQTLLELRLQARKGFEVFCSDLRAMRSESIAAEDFLRIFSDLSLWTQEESGTMKEVPLHDRSKSIQERCLSFLEAFGYIRGSEQLRCLDPEQIVLKDEADYISYFQSRLYQHKATLVDDLKLFFIAATQTALGPFLTPLTQHIMNSEIHDLVVGAGQQEKRKIDVTLIKNTQGEIVDIRVRQECEIRTCRTSRIESDGKTQSCICFPLVLLVDIVKKRDGNYDIQGSVHLEKGTCLPEFQSMYTVLRKHFQCDFVNISQ